MTWNRNIYASPHTVLQIEGTEPYIHESQNYLYSRWSILTRIYAPQLQWWMRRNMFLEKGSHALRFLISLQSRLNYDWDRINCILLLCFVKSLFATWPLLQPLLKLWLIHIADVFSHINAFTWKITSEDVSGWVALHRDFSFVEPLGLGWLAINKLHNPYNYSIFINFLTLQTTMKMMSHQFINIT